MNLPIQAETATDAVKKAVAYVKEHGQERIRWGGTIPAKLGVGAEQNFDRLMLEVPFFALELRNPNARWTNIGQQTFITLAETEDHLFGRNPGILPKYSKLYREWLLPSGRFPYTYGERMMSVPNAEWDGMSQVELVVKHLLRTPNSRKAIIQIRREEDIGLDNPPCNVMFQLEVVDDRLNWTTINRSQDLVNGLTENIFMFTVWQALIASRLDVAVGVYRVVSTNAHLYQKHFDLDLSRFKDPYHYGYNRDWRPTYPLPNFDPLNSIMFTDENGITKAVQAMRSGAIPQPWWKEWKAALVAEWAIAQGDLPNALAALEMAAPAPWAGPVARRLLEKVGESDKAVAPSWWKEIRLIPERTERVR